MVQIVGDGNQANFVYGLPVLKLTTYTSPRYATVDSVLPASGSRHGYTATGKDEAGLLRPYTRSLTMQGREHVQRDLTAWLKGPSPISVQVLVGAGGRGKTRVAVELCAEARKTGWLAGFVGREEMSRFLVQQAVASWRWDQPVLAVVDYAAAKADLLRRWLSELAKHDCITQPEHPKLRLLLLERYGDSEAAWWRCAFGEGIHDHDLIRGMLARDEPIRLGLLTDPNQRLALFAEAYRLASGTSPPPIANLDRLLETQSMGGEPLFLAMSGFSAARIGMQSSLSQSPDKLVINAAKQELARVRTIWSAKGLPVSYEKRLDYHLAAIATLYEGLSEDEAHMAIECESRALHLPVGENTEQIRAALYAALPGDEGGIAPILPDILGEAAMIVAWGETPQGREAVCRAAAVRRDAITRSVVRACQDFLVRGQKAPLLWLQAVRAGVNEVEPLLALVDAMPMETTELRESALEVTEEAVKAVTEVIRHGNARQNSARRATALMNLSYRLSELGKREAALKAAEESVAIRRRLVAEINKGTLVQAARVLARFRVLPNSLSLLLQRFCNACTQTAGANSLARDLTLSLSCLSLRLADLGRREEALGTAEDAAIICRELAAAQPNEFRTNLALVLNTLSLRLSDLGQREPALTAIKEAVEIDRKLADIYPGKYMPNLAISLNNLSNQLFALGRRELALDASEEAVSIYRGLASVKPDAFMPNFAKSLNTFSIRLSELGRRAEALLVIEEALPIYRGLAAARQDAFAPDLAKLLHNLSFHLSSLDRHEAALENIEESLKIYRRLIILESNIFMPELAVLLNSLSVCLSHHGRHEAALKASEEAVSIDRRLASTRLDAFAPNLAMSLNNLSLRLFAVGQREAALENISEALTIYRGLAAAQPDIFAPDLADCLDTQGQITAELEPQVAAMSFEEAIRVLLQYFLSLPQTFSPLMKNLRVRYLAACDAAAREPDAKLIESISCATDVPDHRQPKNDAK